MNVVKISDEKGIKFWTFNIELNVGSLGCYHHKRAILGVSLLGEKRANLPDTVREMDPPQ